MAIDLAKLASLVAAGVTEGDAAVYASNPELKVMTAAARASAAKQQNAAALIGAGDDPRFRDAYEALLAERKDAAAFAAAKQKLESQGTPVAAGTSVFTAELVAKASG